jgi:hypothetical protein
MKSPFRPMQDRREQFPISASMVQSISDQFRAKYSERDWFQEARKAEAEHLIEEYHSELNQIISELEEDCMNVLIPVERFHGLLVRNAQRIGLPGRSVGPAGHIKHQLPYNTYDNLGNCRKCGTEVLWANTASGAWIPLDIEPHPVRGQYALTANGFAINFYGRDSQQMDALPYGSQPSCLLFEPHFATCGYPERRAQQGEWNDKCDLDAITNAINFLKAYGIKVEPNGS